MQLDCTASCYFFLVNCIKEEFNARFSTRGPYAARGRSALLQDLRQTLKDTTFAFSHKQNICFMEVILAGISTADKAEVTAVLTVRIHIDVQGCQSGHNVILPFCVFKGISSVSLLLHTVADKPAHEQLQSKQTWTEVLQLLQEKCKT